MRDCEMVSHVKLGRGACVAEFIGTFALVLFGSLSVTIFASNVLGFSSPAASFIGIAFAHGLVLMSMVYAIGWISGCHINPAITITAVALRRLDFDDGVAYLVAQVLGAVLAGWTHLLIQPYNGAFTHYGGVQPSPAIGGSPLVALLVEIIMTFFLMFSAYAVLYTGKVSQGASGVLIGMTYTADILIAGPLTGGAANPARALGPAIASGDYLTLWVYWVGPIIGALIAGFVYEHLLMPKRK